MIKIKDYTGYIVEQYLPEQTPPKIVYGNPQKYQKEIMDKGSSLFTKVQSQGLWEKWTEENPLDQTSEEIKKEIQELIVIGDSQTQEDKEFVKDSERNHVKQFVEFLRKNGIEHVSVEHIYNILKETDPITFGLKYHFNYPRPYQLANTLNLPLYPSQATNASSPSYPSGHSLDSNIIAGLISKKFPQLKKESYELCEKITKSRLLAGVHYPSDIKFGKKVAEEILDLDLLSL